MIGADVHLIGSGRSTWGPTSSRCVHLARAIKRARTFSGSAVIDLLKLGLSHRLAVDTNLIEYSIETTITTVWVTPYIGRTEASSCMGHVPDSSLEARAIVHVDGCLVRLDHESNEGPYTRSRHQTGIPARVSTVPVVAQFTGRTEVKALRTVTAVKDNSRPGRLSHLRLDPGSHGHGIRIQLHAGDSYTVIHAIQVCTIAVLAGYRDSPEIGAIESTVVAIDRSIIGHGSAGFIQVQIELQTIT
ncbi:hypothetical protein Rhal01_03259 [Rubritalea halochordaticola]|uniref:Uncharacterized protein n=1 Tax=Rubritalea halochordaticola TaxID=714537 RepID=A0ABP9V337_9BACT